MVEPTMDGWSPLGPVTELTESAIWERLRSTSLGRLGVSLDGQPDIFPVNYAVDDGAIVFRTGAGTKLRELAENTRVVLEADQRTDDGVWSVTVKGVAHVVVVDDEVGREARAALPGWIPTIDYVYVRIAPTEVRGRQFQHHLTIGRSRRA